MLLKKKSLSPAVLARYAAIGLLSGSLAACGGGGGSPGSTVGVGGGSGGSGGTTNPGSGTGGSTAPAAAPKLTLALTDVTGAATSNLSGSQSATVKATVLSATGSPVAGAIVNFTTSDSTLLSFAPSSGSALTDASGVAVITAKPSAITSAGAVSITATSVVVGQTATGTSNVAIGASPLTVGALSFTPAPTGSLPPFSAVSLSIPVTSGGQAVSAVSGLTLNSLCVGDGKATLVAGTFANGVQNATYTNNGCLRGTDTITASVGNSSQSITVKVDSAAVGSVQFISSSAGANSLVLKGSGGLGRAESAQLTYRVVDQQGNGLSGVSVNFALTSTASGSIGKPQVNPTTATTDSNGFVVTTVSSGTIPTPVSVSASATRNGAVISGLSAALTISTGLPIQKSMSFSASKFNIEGLDYDGEVANITVRLADQYGNPVSDGTTVNFVAEGGAVGSSKQGACTTLDGECSVPMKSQNFRPVNGRVTVLAFAQGIPTFTDLNGDGQYSCSSFTSPAGNASTVYRPLVDTCNAGAGEPFVALGDAYLDAGSLSPTSGLQAGGTLDGSYDAANGDLPFPYAGSTYSSIPQAAFGPTYIRSSMEITFSGSNPNLVRQAITGTGYRDWTAADGDPKIVAGLSGSGCSAQTLAFRLFDVNNNPMPADTGVSTVDADKIAPGLMSPNKVPSTNAIGGTIHTVIIKPEASCAPGTFSVSVSTPKGTTTLFPFKSN
ncbi:MAG: hypothetical protein ACJ8HI_06285 [Massilia sp.]